MGQKHSAKYSLKQSGANSKQQTAQIEDEVAFNTNSPGRDPDEPVGVNLCSQQNDYIRNAAQAMAKVWTEKAVVVESGDGGNNEPEEVEKEKECPSDGNKTMLKEIEAELLKKKNEPKLTETENEPNMTEENGANLSDKPVEEIEVKEPKENADGKREEKPELPMANNDDVAKDDSIENVVEPEISQEEPNVTQSAAVGDADDDSQPPKEPIIHQSQCEEKAAISDKQIASNPVKIDKGAEQQKIVNEPREQGVDEANMDLYEENDQNEGAEIIGKNGEENEINAEELGTEMPIENVEEKKCVEENVQQENEKKEVEQKNEKKDLEEGQQNLIAEIGENPLLEGIADYVAANQQQAVQILEAVEEEMNKVEAELDEKGNFVPIENQNTEEKEEKQQQFKMDGDAVDTLDILPVEHADPIPTEKMAISTTEGENDEFGEVKQNGHHQNGCQKLAKGNGEEEEPICTGKPSEL